MDTALAWVGWIAEWINRFIPKREILDTTEGAIKYKHGSEIVVCGPGVYWYWPWTTKWASYSTARQTDRLESQTMESKDGKTFIVSATITYSVTDLEAFVTRVHSPLTLVVDTAALAIHNVCCAFDWDTLQEEQRKDTLKTKLRKEAQSMLKEYGLDVIRLQLNTLARCRVLKVAQSVSNEEN